MERKWRRKIGDETTPRDMQQEFGKSFLFLIRVVLQKISSRKFFLGAELASASAVCSLSRTAIKSFGEVLEIPEKRKYFLFPSESPKASWKIEERRSTRHLFVPTTASGTQGEKPLVDGKKFVREVGKLELYLWKKIWLNRFFQSAGEFSRTTWPPKSLLNWS